jgi:hypothetical protein
MNISLEAELLENAIKIGEEIIEKATIDSKGIHWRTIQSVNASGDLETAVDESIATGVSGILLFYNELYNTTSSEVYLEYINSSSKWLIDYCQKNPATHGFYSGRMGAVYTLLKISEVTQQERYCQLALEIGSQFKNISSVEIQKYNIYNGLAGTTWGLLYLYTKTKENWLLDTIYEAIEILVKNIKSNGIGFYWDSFYAEGRSIGTKPLCGIPFGSSGIGLLFMHLGKYFNNEDYKYIAIQALKYEDQYYDENELNWPDLRIAVDHKSAENHRKAYRKNNYAHFETKAYCNNWMFGRAGNVFSRLQAHNILKEKYPDKILSDIESSLTASDIESQLLNNTLATGKGGLGLLLLKLFNLENNPTFLDNASALAMMAIDESTSKKFYQFGFDVETEYEDDSLLQGNAGIGYFFLKRLNKDNDYVLYPELNGKADADIEHPIYNFSISYAVDKIACAWYPATTSLFNDKLPFKSSDLNLDDLRNSLLQRIEEVVHESGNSQIIDAFQYDTFKLNAQGTIHQNAGHFRFSRTTEISKNKKLLNDKSRSELMAEVLTLNQYSRFFSSNWDWKNTKGSTSHYNEFGVYTLHSLNEEYTLSKIQYTVLKAFKSPQRVNKIYKVFTDMRGNNEDPDYSLHTYLDTISFFMGAGVLISANNSIVSKQYFALKPRAAKLNDEFFDKTT